MPSALGAEETAAAVLNVASVSELVAGVPAPLDPSAFTAAATVPAVQAQPPPAVAAVVVSDPSATAVVVRPRLG